MTLTIFLNVMWLKDKKKRAVASKLLFQRDVSAKAADRCSCSDKMIGIIHYVILEKSREAF